LLDELAARAKKELDAERI
jgi:hypothetical protein